MKFRLDYSDKQNKTYKIITSKFTFDCNEDEIEMFVMSCIDLPDKTLEYEAAHEELEDKAEHIAHRILYMNRKEYVTHDSQIISNILRNITRKDRKDIFSIKDALKDQEIIFIGAGPSVYGFKDEIVKANQFIMTGGTGMAVCDDLGIVPDLILAMDPNDAQLKRYKKYGSKFNKTPILYDHRLNADCLESWKGPKISNRGTDGYNILPLDSGDIDEWEGGLNSLISSGTIGLSTWCYEVAKFLGAAGITFYGLDCRLYGKGNRFLKYHPNTSFSDGRLKTEVDKSEYIQTYRDYKVTEIMRQEIEAHEQLALKNSQLKLRRRGKNIPQIKGLADTPPPTSSQCKAALHVKELSKQYWFTFNQWMRVLKEELDFWSLRYRDLEFVKDAHWTNTFFIGHFQVAQLRAWHNGSIDINPIIANLQKHCIQKMRDYELN